jgi:8-oxo-dGTP diphosphatase
MTTPVYCPICTHKLELREAGGRIRPVCPNCGYVHYVNPVPTVGVVIEMDDGLVLIRRANPPHQGEWTFPSGYVEADERLEEAAVREAEEETGLKVEIVELADVNSYPEGPPASGIMVFYRARPVGGELRGGDDALEAKVFRPEDVPLLPFRTHREVMARWLQMREIQAPRLSDDLPPIEAWVRPAVPGDAQQIVELVRMMSANRDLSEEEWHDVLLRAKEMPTLEIFVAQSTVHTPLLIGCVALSVVRTLTEHYGLINDMAVLPTYRRQGIGAALLKAVMKRAAELNLHTLVVNTARANEAAQEFYAESGFTPLPVMQLRLR